MRKKKVTHSGKTTLFWHLYMTAHLSLILTRKFVGLQAFVSLEIVERVCTFAENKVDLDLVFDANINGIRQKII